MAGNTAEANRLLAGGELATKGATSNLQYSMPQQVPPGNAYVSPFLGQALPGFDSSSAMNRGAAYSNASSQYGQTSNTQNALNTIDQNSNLLNQLAYLNPSDSTDVNQLIAGAAGHFSSSDYANLKNLTNSLRSSYAQILVGRGSNPVDATTKANQTIPDGMNFGAMKEVMQMLHAEGQNVLNQQSNQYQNTISGGNPAYGGNTGGGSGEGFSGFSNGGAF
jgi:hypothetical protein